MHRVTAKAHDASDKCVLRWPSVLLAAILLFPLLAQEPESSTTIRANVPLVLAPVTVTDKKGNFIDGLQVEDFRLNDDGVPQQIRMDTSDTVLAPVSLMVLIQASGISAPVLARTQQVGGMIKPLVIGERGRAAVIEFDDEIRVRTDFTADSTIIRSAFEGTRSRSIRTARLIDAVMEGVKMLETRPPNNRRVMLILSESRDRGSKTKLSEAVELAQRAGVAIYPLTYSVQASTFVSKPSDSPSMPGGDNNVDFVGGIVELGRIAKANAAAVLARSTGGHHMAFLTLGSLEEAISRTGEEIHSQYLLSFTPTLGKRAKAKAGKKDEFHEIQVAIPSRPDAVIRVRPGYWPEK
ncbi:MAG: VWA domain-containing protein [Acidobacteriota bacterium]